MNKMMYYLKLCASFPKVIFVKMRYRKKIECNLMQLWGKRIEFHSIGNGIIYIGRKLKTRSDVHLIAQNGKIFIGNNVFMNYNVSITSLSSIIIEDNVTIANNVVIVDHDHIMKSDGNQFSAQAVKICQGAWIGANSVILKGVTVGKNAVVAAGAVVTKDVPAEMTVCGVPARVINR